MSFLPSNELIITFSIYSFFVFYLQKWTTIFRGASLGFGFFINWFMIIATIYGLAFLVYYGYKVDWTAPLVLFGISLLIKGAMIVVESILFSRIPFIIQIIGTLGFIACPILGYRLLIIASLI